MFWKGGCMNWIFDNDKPIYKQLVEKLELAIITGKYQPDEKLPSVREFAMEMKVNPNTVQKALQELEQLGFIYTVRTNGKFVTHDKKLIVSYRNQLAKEKVTTFLEDIKLLGLTKEEILNYVKDGSELK